VIFSARSPNRGDYLQSVGGDPFYVLMRIRYHYRASYFHRYLGGHFVGILDRQVNIEYPH
jgi:hypothetical protein